MCGKHAESFVTADQSDPGSRYLTLYSTAASVRHSSPCWSAQEEFSIHQKMYDISGSSATPLKIQIKAVPCDEDLP